MQTYSSKLIVLRGNSGSGKSTVARRLREASKHKIAIIEQDYLRRYMLREKETDGGNNLGLIEQTVEYALAHGYDVILEGILYFPRYGKLLKRLSDKCPENYFYYFDVGFEETLKRHDTKPNSHEFGKKEMREWYKNNDLTHFQDEQIIPESYSIEDSVKVMLQQTGL